MQLSDDTGVLWLVSVSVCLRVRHVGGLVSGWVECAFLSGFAVENEN
jgi:hypothetical protein